MAASARGGGCLILPTWNHLWFVAYLWVYTLLLWVLLRAWPRALDAIAARAGACAARRRRGLWLPIAVLALLRMALIDRFPPTHALVDDWYRTPSTSACSSSARRWARDASAVAALRRAALARARRWHCWRGVR